MPDIPEVSNTLQLIILVLLVLLRDRVFGATSPSTVVNGVSIADLQYRIGEIRARLDALEEKEIPPPLFKAQVDRLEHRVDTLIEKCDSIRGCAYHQQQLGDPHLD